MHQESIHIDNPLASEIEELPDGGLLSPQGFTAGGLHAGIKKRKLDLAWLYSQVPAAAAGVYTQNAFKAAPLVVNEASIAVEGSLQGVLVNSGVANACTGKQGLEDAYAMRRLLAQRFGMAEHLGAVLSTGVIGEFLPMDRLSAGIAKIQAFESLRDGQSFEEAIMTTDTVRKRYAVSMSIEGTRVFIGGAAKGSGMIHPNMATMLAFVTTDAAVEPSSLQAALRSAAQDTFNMVAVDGDTSTNDMVLAMANGMAGAAVLSTEHPEWEKFCAGLQIVCGQLAKQIARDGEGATKLIEVWVKGAPSEVDAKKAAKAVILSSLVKSAIFGTDANWGRIVCAVGYSGASVDPDQVDIYLGDLQMMENGMPLKFDEDAAKAYLQESEIRITIDLKVGGAQAVAWGCDLTYDYVRINADYRS